VPQLTAKRILIGLLIFLSGITLGAYSFYYFNSNTPKKEPSDNKQSSSSAQKAQNETRTFTDPTGIVSVVVEYSSQDATVYLMEESTTAQEIQPLPTKTKLLTLKEGEYSGNFDVSWSNKVPDFGFAILVVTLPGGQVREFYLISVEKNTAKKIDLPNIISGKYLVRIPAWVDGDSILVETNNNEGTRSFWTIDLSNPSKAKKVTL